MKGLPRELYGAPREIREPMTHKEPPTILPEHDALIAAMIEHCAETMGFHPPEWTENRSRFLEAPWIFSHQRRTLYNAPGPFIRHGVLFDWTELNGRGGEKHLWNVRP